MKILPRSAVVALLLINSSLHAVMQLDLTYDTNTDITTVAFDGSWDVFSFDGTTVWSFLPDVKSTYVYILSTSHDYSNIGLSHTSGDILPDYGTTTIDSWSGAIGFDTNSIYAPTGYTAGDTITAFWTRSGDFLGLTATAPLSGVYQGSGNTVNWSGSVIPEAAHSTLLLSLVPIFWFLRRKRGSE